MEAKHYYRCRSNPSGPLLMLDSEWEAKEMTQNTEYDEVDADGLPVIGHEIEFAHTIPFSVGK